jgi:CheY-like chemotaxis protein
MLQRATLSATPPLPRLPDADMESLAMTTILLVEDNEMNRDMLTRRLERKSFKVLCAPTGQAGVEMSRQHRPDIILMDVALGEMDGWEATQLIKADQETAEIPVIALTAHALASDRQKSIEVGCADFDTKPIDLPRLLEKIRVCLERAWGEDFRQPDSREQPSRGAADNCLLWR